MSATVKCKRGLHISKTQDRIPSTGTSIGAGNLRWEQPLPPARGTESKSTGISYV